MKQSDLQCVLSAFNSAAFAQLSKDVPGLKLQASWGKLGPLIGAQFAGSIPPPQYQGSFRSKPFRDFLRCPISGWPNYIAVGAVPDFGGHSHLSDEADCDLPVGVAIGINYSQFSSWSSAPSWPPSGWGPATIGIQLACCTKYYVRFIPVAWDQPGNSHGNAWPGSNRTVVFELNLVGKRPYLVAVTGKAPDKWMEPLWARAANPPFRLPRRRVTRPRHWCSIYYADGVPVNDLDPEEILDPSELAKKLYDWVVKSIQAPQAQQFIAAVAEELPKLDACYRAGVRS